MNASANILLYGGYVLMLIALLSGEQLWLRGLLSMAQLCLAIAAVLHDAFAVAVFNALCVAVNAIWTLRLLRRRRAAALPEAMRTIYERHFAALRPEEFLRFWSWGTEHRACDVPLAGATQDTLCFLMDGSASIQGSESREPRQCRVPGFVGDTLWAEGSAPASDVVAIGELRYRSWPWIQLRRIRKRNPQLWTRIECLLARDHVLGADSSA